MKKVLKNDGKLWVKEGIITNDQLKQINKLYSSKDKRPDYLFTILAIIGALLVGLGIILVFAYNWWNFPRIARMMLAFIPLIAAQCISFYVYDKQKSIAWREGSGIFHMSAVFATIALINQTYHSSSHLISYFTVCFLLISPVIYFLKSNVVFFAYLIALTFITTYQTLFYADDFLNINWNVIFLYIAIIPFIYLKLKSAPSRKMQRSILLFITMIFGNYFFYFFETSFKDYDLDFITLLIIFSQVLIILNQIYNKWQKDNPSSVFKMIGIFCMTITLFCYSLIGFLSNFILLIIGIVLGGIYYFLRDNKNRYFSGNDVFVIIGILLLIFGLFNDETVILYFSSGLMFITGIYFIFRGIQTVTSSYLNYGLIMTFMIIAIRFFSVEISILIKGILFLILGIFFMVLNIKLHHKQKEMIK